MKANLPKNEFERLEALKLYNILDTLPEQIFDDLTLLASSICQTPISVISFVDESRQWFKSAKGLDAQEVSRDVGFCAHAILESQTVIVPDASVDNRFSDNPLVTDGLKIRYYAGTPLVNKDGYSLGTLCVIDIVPRELSANQISALEALGRQAMAQIENRLNILQLEKSEAKYKSLSNSLETEVEKRVNEIEIEKQKINSILLNAPATIAILNGPEHIFEFANERFMETVGHREILGKPIIDALPKIIGQGFFEIFDSVYKTGKPFIGNEIPSYIDKQSNGQVKKIYWNFICQPIYDKNNKVIGLVSFGYDITEQVVARKQVEELNKNLLQSETKYKELLESLELKVEERTLDLSKANEKIDYERNKLNNLLMNAPAMIAVLEGPNHVFKLSNHIFQKVTGNRNFIDKPYREALPELSGQGFYELLDNAYNTGELFLGKEIPADLDLNSDGILIRHYFNFIYQPALDINNQVIGISMFAFDVTEQVNARKEIERLYNQVQISNEALKSFAHIASHDLQEPLRTITGYTQLLSRRYKDVFDENASQFMDYIVEGTKRMKTLIEDILNYSEIQLKDHDTLTDLNEVFENVKDNLKISIEEKKVILTSDKLPIVKTEKSHMLQLIQNLVSNAIKYSKNDINPIIHISAQNKDNQWIISISDNGIGINQQHFDRIFQLFQRLHGLDTYKGTGIGLANCKKIVEMYGGKIWVESKENISSTFYFSLPV